MVQGGDPTGTGRGGTSIYGERFADEISPELRFVGAGILAMANSGPNTNGELPSTQHPRKPSLLPGGSVLTLQAPNSLSLACVLLKKRGDSTQTNLNLQAPTPFLDGKHTIFGRISSGMQTVQRLEAVRTDANDRPLEDIKIHKARLGDAASKALTQ